MLTDLPENVQGEIIRELNAGDFVAAKSIHDDFIQCKDHHDDPQSQSHDK